MDAVTATTRAAITSSAPPLSAPVCARANAWRTELGNTETMPAKMIRETPLPTPRLVICSPNHIRNMVPPVRVATVEMEEDAGLVDDRSEEHTSELQSLMRTSYAVFCL